MKTDIQELFCRIMSVQIISLVEQNLIASLLQEDNIEETERALIKRLFYGVERGLVKVAS